MKEIQETLRGLRTDLDNERRVRVCIQEAQELERSRITAVEDAVNVQARQFPELITTLAKDRNVVDANKRNCDGRRDANANALGAVQTEFNAVLEAHTASIFRLGARLDHISEQFAAAGFEPIHQSNAKHLADDDRPNVEGEVDRTEGLINSAGADARDPVSPLRT